MTEIISKVRETPPLCRPTISADEAPLDVIQVMKQSWSEEPANRPNFEDIFKQVEMSLNDFIKSAARDPMCYHAEHCLFTVQEHHKGKEDQHH